MGEGGSTEVRISEGCGVRALAEGEGQRLAASLAAVDPWLTLGYGEAALASYLTRPDPALERHALVGAGGLAGVACVRYPWLRGPYVELLAVLPAEQGKGLGREVLSWLECDPRWARANLWVAVSDFNRRARDFYRRHGYEEVGVLSRLVSAGSDELLLRKRLSEGAEEHRSS